MKRNGEKGMLIVEATIVFPVMFLVIFFLLFAGNAYFQMCRIEGVVNTLTVEGAAQCGDPQLAQVEAGNFPGVGSLSVEPYRYVFNNMGRVTGPIRNKMESRLRGLGTGLFSHMKPKVRTVQVDYKGYFIYATFASQVEYELTIPVRLLGEKDFTILKRSVRVEMPVTDSPELIRNVDMVQDYLDRTGVTEELKKMADQVTKWFKK